MVARSASWCALLALSLAVCAYGKKAAELTFDTAGKGRCTITHDPSNNALVSDCDIHTTGGSLADRVTALEGNMSAVISRLDAIDHWAPTQSPTAHPTEIDRLPTLECKTIEQGGGSASNTATAACPAGWQLAGGGFHDIDQNGGGSASDEFHSRPEGNGWYVRSVGWLGTAATGPPPLDF